jgi:glyoxylase-like metal-dependent hydrolase (beta-lactamase superfamily II)
MVLVTLLVAPLTAQAQQPPAPTPPGQPQGQPAPLFATRKVTDNVYIFRYGGHQAMFVVTPDGVIATDPIAYRRPEAAVTYIDEIRKITQAPIKYVVYSHHHYDHIEGGKPFKDAGATFMLVPRDRIIFTGDFIPFENLQFRDMPDGYLPDFFESLDRMLSLDWDRMIPGHPYAGGRLGTKDDVRAAKQYLTDLSDAVKPAALAGKCFDAAIKEIKLPKYEKWANYEAYLPGNIERFCEYWGRG